MKQNFNMPAKEFTGIFCMKYQCACCERKDGNNVIF